MLSIITAFGCKYDCRGCIHWNISKVCYPTTFWQNPSWQKALAMNVGTEPFSVSGGGDPMNAFNDNVDFWHYLEALCQVSNLEYDVHTSYDEIFKLVKKEKKVEATVRLWHPDVNMRKNDKMTIFEFEHLRKVVFHLRNQYVSIPEIGNVETRFAYVVDDKATIDGLERLEKEIPERCKLSYRELVPCGEVKPPKPDVDEFARSVSERRAGAIYVEQKDYNKYLWPDGTIKTKFLS